MHPSFPHSNPLLANSRHYDSHPLVLPLSSDMHPSLIPRHLNFRAHPVASWKNRVWTCSLVKLEHNYTSISACCCTKQIAQVKFYITTNRHLAEFLAPKQTVLVTDNAINTYNYWPPYVNLSQVKVSRPFFSFPYPQGMQKIWSGAETTPTYFRCPPTRSTLTKSTPTRSTPTRSTSHQVNSHEINSHEINSH